MPFISITRLRIRSLRFLPGFAQQAMRTLVQLKTSPGFQRGALLADRNFTFWTATAWDSGQNMRAYMTTAAHRDAMPRLQHWCDEASVVHWEQPDDLLPSWPQADRRMREDGRPSTVLHPSSHHATLSFRAPRTSFSGPIKAISSRQTQ